MKKWLLLLMTVLWCWVASAQSTANYTFTTGTDGSLSDMSSGATVLVGAGLDDTPSPVTNIGFDFVLMGVPYSQFSVTENGLMRLGGTAITSSLYVIPSTTVPLISPFGNDMRVGTDGAVSYKLFGVAPNRYLTVQWKNNMIRYATAAAGTATWEVRIYETTGVIQLVYGTMTTNAASPTVYYVGFAVNTTSNNVLSVNTATHTASVTAPVTSNSYTASSTITDLHSTADGSRRYYTFTPPAAAEAPTALNFTGVTGNDMVLNWTDSPDETSYAVYRSDDGGATYSFVASLAANTVTYDQSASLAPGTTYFWRVYALNEGRLSTALQGSQATNAPGALISVANGNWSAGATWNTGVAPTTTDNVTIADGFTVTVDAAANCYNLIVGQGTSGVLAMKAFTLSVANDITVSAGGTLNMDATGGTAGVVSVAGNLTNNGTFDLYTSGTVYAGLTFTGAANKTFSGTGATTDIRTLTINKGTSYNSILTLSPTNFTVQETVVDGTPMAFLTLTNGTLKVAGTFTMAGRVFTTASYTIGATAGFWLDNPNFIVSAQTGSPTLAGWLKITQGIFNVGTASGNSVGLSSNSRFEMTGGALNVAGRFAVSSATNVTNFTQSGGTITLNTVGHVSTTYYTFDMGTSASSVFTMSGGNIIIQRGSGAAYNSGYDFRGNNGTATITGGSVQFGYASAPAGCAYKMLYNTPTVIVDATNNPSLTLAGNTIVYGDLTFNGTGTFSMSFGYALTLKGNSLTYPGNFTNAGTFTANASASNILSFNGSFGDQTFTNSGTITANTISQLVINNTLAGTVTIPDNIKISYTSGTPAFTLTKGTLTATGLQLGDGGTAGFAFTLGDGTFTNAPSFLFGSGTVDFTYSGTSPQITGSELPATISGTFKINNSTGVTLNSALSAGKLNLTSGVLTTTGANLLTVTGTLVADVAVTSGYVNGPLARTVPASNTTNDYNFPIGKGTLNSFELIDPTTTAGGSVVVKAEVFDANCGGFAGSGLQSINSDRYWKAEVISGSANLTNTKVKVTDASVVATTALGQSATQGGTYISLGGSLSGQTLTSITAIDNLATNGYFVLGAKAPMVYVSGTAVQANTTNVDKGALNQAIINLQVVTSGADPALNATEWVFTTAGSTNATDNTDIVNAKLYYTGLSGTFATTTQIGSTITDLSTGTLTFTATQALADGTNYFWLTYDIDAAATNNNVVDATCTSVTVDGSPRIPTVTNPTGNRTIFTATPSNLLTENFDGAWPPANWLDPITAGSADQGARKWYRGDDAIVTDGGNAGLNPGNGGSGYCADFNTYDIPSTGTAELIWDGNLNLSTFATATLKFYLKNTSGSDVIRVYIRNASDAWVQVGSASYGVYANWTQVTISLDAYLAYTAADIRFVGTSDYGTTNIGLDDVTIDGSDAPNMKYISSTTTQTLTTPVIVGSTNNQIVGVQVVTQYNANPFAMGDLVFNTNGSTNAVGDIENAKLYYTGTTGTFATTTQVGATVTDLSGDLTFTPVALNLAAGTNYFWLTYDIKAAGVATSGNLVDAECTSVTVGTAKTPLVTAPAGTRTVSNDKMLSSVTITQASSDFVLKGSTNNPILKTDFYVTGADNTLILNSIEFTAQNTSNADIAAGGVKLWNSQTDDFATAAQVGVGMDFTAGAAVFGGLAYDLPVGHNYFWLTYDVIAGATSSNTLDAQVGINKINVAGTTYPSVAANPAGTRRIIGLYPMPYTQNFNAGTTLPTDWSGTMSVNATHGANSTNGLTYNLYSSATTCNAVAPYTGPVNSDAIFEFWYRIVNYTGYPATGTTLAAGNKIEFQVSTDGVTYTTKYTIDNGNHVTSNAFVKKTFSLADYAGQKIFIKILGTWSTSGDYYIDFDDIKVYDPQKMISSILGTSPSVLPVLTSSVNNPVLKLDLNVEGYLGTLPLDSIYVTGVNTADADVEAVKLFVSATDNFSTAVQLGTDATFTASRASFTGLNHELAEGHNYVWVTYDIAAGATLTNTVDAKILTNDIYIKGATYNSTDIDPVGTRTINNDKFINSIVVTQASTKDLDKGTLNNPILLVDFDVLGSTGSLLLNSIEFTHTCSNVGDIATPNGVKIWRNSSNDFSSAVQIGTGMDYSATLANFADLAYDLPSGHTYLWLTHDVSATAVAGDYMDAKIAINKISVGAATYPAVEANPAGYRNILAAPVTTFPIVQGFEDATFPPTNWRACRNTAADGGLNGNVLLNNSTNNWFRCTSASFSGSGATYIHTGSASTAIGYTAPDYSWLITPQMTFPVAPMHLKFWPWFFNEPDYPGDFSVLVYADGAWQSVLYWDGAAADNQFLSEVDLDLTAFGGKTVKIAFVFKQVGNYQMAIDDIQIFDASKVLSSVTVTQDLTTPVFPTAVQKRILKLDFNVTGTVGTLPLNSITVNSANTSDADIANNGVKLYVSTTDDITTATQLGTGKNFTASEAAFTALNHDLATGHNYVWVTYDIAALAVPGNFVDAIIRANAINVAGSTYNVADEDPAGNRLISNDKFVETVLVSQASSDAVLKGSVKNAILKVDFSVSGATGTLPLNSIEFTSLNTLNADLVTPNGVQLWRSATDNLAEAVSVDSMDYAAGIAAFTGLAYDLPVGHTYFWLVYDVSATAVSYNILDSKIAVNKINVNGSTFNTVEDNPAGSRAIMPASVNTYPYVQPFAAVPPTDWQATGGTNNWALSVGAAYANFWGWTAGKTAYLTTLPFDITSLATPKLSFKWSHKYSASYPDDKLEIFISTNYGSTWTSIWMKTGTDLNSNDGAADQAPGTYATSVIDLASYAGQTVRFRFIATSGYGPNLYIDDVTLRNVSSNADLTNITLSAGSLVPAFDAATLSYTALVNCNVASVTLSPVKADANANANVTNPTDLAGDLAARTAIITVTAEDGITNKTYEVVFSYHPTPAVFAVSGDADFCFGTATGTVALDGSEVGVNYQLKKNGANEGIAKAGDGNPLSWAGISATGVYTVVATNPTTICSSDMTGSATIDVYPLPVNQNLTAPAEYCAGSPVTITLEGSESDINYQLRKDNANEGTALAGTGLALEWADMTAGEYTVIATTVDHSCVLAMEDTITITENPVPVAYNFNASSLNFCAGGNVDLSLDDSEIGVNYQLKKNNADEGAAIPGTGDALVWEDMTEGEYMVVATNAHSCSTDQIGTLTITDRPYPADFDLTAPADYCAGTTVTIQLAGSETGVTYQLKKDMANQGAGVAGTGSALEWAGMTEGEYTVIATSDYGCETALNDTISVIEKDIPSVFNLTSSATEFCDGSSVSLTLSGSEATVSYQLLKGGSSEGASVAGNGNALEWTNITEGIYTILATHVSGCELTMNGTETIIKNPLPMVYNLTAPASYCAGSNVIVSLSNSEIGVSYQLIKNGDDLGVSVDGTGSSMDWTGLTIGTYTMEATTSEGCSVMMNGNKVVDENPLPTVYTISAPAEYCEGTVVEIDMDGSQNGVNYELFKNTATVGFTLAGNGAAIDWANITAGEYYVEAHNALTGCSSLMTGTLTITENPLPALFDVTAPATYCAGNTVEVSLSGSEIGISYQLKKNNINEGVAVDGTGLELGFANMTSGSYTVLATTGEGCSRNMTGTAAVVENENPAIYTISAPASYCEGSVVEIDITGSQNGVNYELFKDGTSVGFTLAGNGSDFSWANITAGEYYVIAENALTHCTRTMSGTPTIVENPKPSITNAADFSICEGVQFDFSPSSVVSSTYAWSATLTSGNLSYAASGSGDIHEIITNNANTNGILKYAVIPTSDEFCVGDAVNVNVTVYPSAIAGNITADEEEICAGTSTNLHLSGYVGTIQWQKFDGTTYVDIDGQTSVDLATGALSNVSKYLAKLSSGSCAAVTTDVMTIAVNAIPSAPASDDVTICFNELVPDLAAIPDGLNTIKWYSDSELTDLLYTGTTYETGKTAVGSYTYYVTQVSGTCESPANEVVLEIKPLPVVSVLAESDPTSCGASDGVISLTDDVNYTYAWSGTTATTASINVGAGTYTPTVTFDGCSLILNAISLSDPGAPVVNLVSDDADNIVCNGTQVEFTATGADSYSFTVDAVNAGTTNPLVYTMVNNGTVNKNVVVAVTGTTDGCQGNKQITVTVHPSSVAGTASASPATICSGSTTSISLSGSVGTIAWQRSIDWNGTTGDWTSNGNTNASFNTVVLTQDTWYKAVVTSGTCSSVETVPVKVTVDQPSVAGTAAADLAVACYNTTAEMELTGYTGTIQWRKSFDGAGFSNIDGYTNPTFTTIPLTANVWYQAVVKNGVCPSATSSNAYIEVTPLSVAGNVSVSEATICQNDDVTVSVANNLGTIDWETSVNGTDFTSNLETGTSFVENLMSDTWFRTKVTNGVCDAVYSSAIKVTVNPVSVAGTASANPLNVIAGGNTQLTLTGYTGNIQWERSINNVDWNNVSGVGGTNPVYTTNAIVQETYYRAKVTNGVCDAVYSNVLTINVTPVYTVSFNVNNGTSNIYEANVVLNGIGSLLTNAAGNCTFNNVVPGNYTYSVTKAGYSLVAGSLVVTTANVVVDPIQINLIYNVNFTVANDLGTAIADAEITFGGEVLGAGVYSIDSVFAGTYAYNVHKNGHLDAIGSIVVTNANVTKSVTLDRIFDVTFVVTDDTLGAIANAIVTLDGVTYPAGQYVFDSVLVGSYDYTVEYAGHITETGSLEVVNANVTKNVELQRVYTVTFAVTDGVNPINDAVITFNGITNAAGNYVFANVIPADGLAYTVSRADYDTETGIVDVYDQNITENVTLNLTRYTVTFVVGDGLNLINDAVVTLNGVTQAAGNYIFADMLPGTYSYSVAKTAYNTVTGTVTVTAADISESVVINLTRYTVTFNITDGVNPIADAVVTFNGVTNAAGDYVFANILPGNGYAYSVSRAGYDTETGTIDLGNENQTVTVVMDLTRYSVTFNVTSGATPITDAIITLNGVSQAAGVYTFANILPGTYNYSVTRAGFNTVTNSVTVINANITVPVSMVLTTYTVTFNVTDGASALTNAVVTFNGVTNAAGNYTFADVLPGTYNYTVTKNGYDVVNGSLTVADQNVTQTVTMNLTRYAITFNVTSAGSALAGAIVICNGVTNAAGDYVFTNMLPGTYAYSVTKPGYSTSNGNVVVTNQNVTQNVSLNLITYIVSFNVTEGGTALAGAVVTFNGVTNPAGNYLFSGIVPGTYAYSVTKAGYETATGSVTVVNANITQPVPMTLITYSVTFNVTDGTNALTGATVTLNGVTNPAGNYVFNNIAPGTYNYSVTKAGYVSATGSVTVTSANITQPVTLTLITYSVTFTVTDGTNTVTGATITLNGVTNPAGNYVFAGMTPGTYNYTVAKAGYISATGTVTVANANVTQPAVLTLITYSVTFTVTDGTTAINDAIVTLNGVSNTAGNYVFNNIAPGTYAYTVAKEGYVSTTGNVTVVAANIVQPVVIELITYSVTFTVTDGENALTDAVITFNGVTNAAGNYVFSGVVPGTYSYSVVKAGYVTQTGSLSVSNANVVENVELVLITYTVGFEVTSNGIDINDAVVTFNGISNEAGDYIFEDVVPGTYDYMVVREGFEVYEGSATVVDANLLVTVELVPVVEVFDVTFNVNMAGVSGFDVANDTVYFSGSMVDWAVPGTEEQLMMTDNDNDMIYTITLVLPAAEYTYKYYINAGLEGAENGDNRSLVVATDTTVNDIWYTAINPLNEYKVSVYPNPFVSSFTLSNAGNIDKVVIADYNGKQMMSVDNNGKELVKVNASQLSQGVYFIHLMKGNRIVATQKLVKQ